MLGEERLGQGQKKSDVYPGEALVDSMIKEAKEEASIIQKQADEIKELKAKIEALSKTEPVNSSGDQTI